MWSRIRDVLIALILPVIIIVALIAPAIVTRDAQRHQEELTCVIIESNVTELAALKSIARELGLPAQFEIPEVPESCDEHSQP